MPYVLFGAVAAHAEFRLGIVPSYNLQTPVASGASRMKDVIMDFQDTHDNAEWLERGSFCVMGHDRKRFFRAIYSAVGVVALSLFGAGCATPAETAGLAGGLSIGAAAVTPTHELEQVYYVGVFDPDEQIPHSVYRLRVHGQSSPLNNVQFASGWVPAELIDSLGSRVSINPNAQTGATIQAAATGQEANLEVGRRMMMFGPEGFRQAPAGYRLVIVMGADPSKFFDAVDQALGDSSQATAQQGNAATQVKLFGEFQAIVSSRQKLDGLKIQEATDLPKSQ